MTDDGGPWGRQTPPSRTPPPQRPEPPRLAAALAVLLALAVLVFALARAFPEAVRTVDDWSSVAYAAGLAALLSAGLWRARGAGLARHLRHAAVWTAIAALLALAFAYRHELAQVPRRLQMAARPGAPALSAARELTIPQDDLGGYVILGEVNGRPVRFLVDTGATDTVLSPDDAARLGLDPGALTYDQRAEGSAAARAPSVNVARVWAAMRPFVLRLPVPNRIRRDRVQRLWMPPSDIVLRRLTRARPGSERHFRPVHTAC